MNIKPEDMAGALHDVVHKPETNHRAANAQRQAAYKERMRAAGFVQVAVWVPADRKSELVVFAESLKKSPQEERGRNETGT